MRLVLKDYHKLYWNQKLFVNKRIFTDLNGRTWSPDRKYKTIFCNWYQIALSKTSITSWFNQVTAHIMNKAKFEAFVPLKIALYSMNFNFTPFICWLNFQIKVPKWRHSIQYIICNIKYCLVWVWWKTRVCGYAGTRICGYADMRICGYAGMRVCGYAGMRICGYADMRVCGYAGMRICGYAGTSNWFNNKQISKTH